MATIERGFRNSREDRILPITGLRHLYVQNIKSFDILDS